MIFMPNGLLLSPSVSLNSIVAGASLAGQISLSDVSNVSITNNQENGQNGTITLLNGGTITNAAGPAHHSIPTLVAPSLIRGTSGDDTLQGMDGLQVFRAYHGNDTVHANGGSDVIYGGEGYDRLYGGADDDVLYGNSGNDRLHGGTGDDILHGNSDDDVIYGNEGNDLISGGLGNDMLYGGLGDDTLKGDSGEDWIWAGSGNDTVSGGAGDDILMGEGGLDILHGGAGNDILYGGGSSDRLYGDAGDDRLYGGSGTNWLIGGADADGFVIDLNSFDGTPDKVADFNLAEGDFLCLEQILSDFSPIDSLITDFLSVTETGGNSTLAVDRDGAGDAHAFQDVMILKDIIGLDILDVYNNGAIIT